MRMWNSPDEDTDSNMFGGFKSVCNIPKECKYNIPVDISEAKTFNDWWPRPLNSIASTIRANDRSDRSITSQAWRFADLGDSTKKASNKFTKHGCPRTRSRA